MNRKLNLYKKFLIEREEIMKHKWIESEKRGYDVGFDHALTSWTSNYRKQWLKEYNNSNGNLSDDLDVDST